MGRPGRAALTLLPDVGLTLAALLIGWGLDDVPGFFRNPARIALVVAVIMSYVAGTLLGIEFHPLRKGNRAGQRWPIVAGMSTVPILWGILSFWDRRGIFVFPDLAAIRYAGVVAYACGEIVRLWALRELGRQYSAFITIQPEHNLVRSGLYRLIRHPFYLGQILIVPGIMLTFRSPVALLIFAASLVFVLKRIGREEQMLLGEFNDDYRDYQRHSWRLVPWVY